MDIRSNDTDRGKPNDLKKTPVSVPFRPPIIDLGLNPGHSDEKPKNNQQPGGLKV
jgi:hypothetical protein